MPAADLEAIGAAQRATEAALKDAHRERDEAQARADRAERRLSRMTTTLLIVVCVIALTAVGIFLTPDQVAGLLTGAK